MEGTVRGRSVAVGAALGLVFGLGLQAAENPPSSTTAAKENPDRVICKSEPITGTRITKRVCHTAREWEQMRQDAQDIMQQGQTHQNNPSGT